MFQIRILILGFILLGCHNQQQKFSFPNEDNKVFVWVFMDYECPISQFYTKTLNEISLNYPDSVLKVIAVFPGIPQKADALTDFKKEYKVIFHMQGDEKLALTNRFEAKITPEVFLTKRDKFYYQGMIDNAFVKLGEQRATVTEKHLIKAISALMDGVAYIPAKTEAVGCVIEK